jgi:hypothetical protein|tara:strand:- start:325 stop:600 length:276 start_codon:yes stop_codon:yes gene_type:complete
MNNIRNLNSGFFISNNYIFFFDRNLYPNNILKKVKILMPPSIGIHGGGQQFGPEGGPGWGKKSMLINIIINNNINFLLKIIVKNMFFIYFL